MDDPISRQAALEAIKHAELGKEYEAVEALPTIEERKTGRWIDPTPENGMIYDKKAYAECSVCGQKEYLGRGKKYCPNCGSYMRGEEHER